MNRANKILFVRSQLEGSPLCNNYNSKLFKHRRFQNHRDAFLFILEPKPFLSLLRFTLPIEQTHMYIFKSVCEVIQKKSILPIKRTLGIFYEGTFKSSLASFTEAQITSLFSKKDFDKFTGIEARNLPKKYQAKQFLKITLI